MPVLAHYPTTILSTSSKTHDVIKTLERDVNWISTEKSKFLAVI